MSKWHAYTIEYKVEVIKFAETHTNRETGRNYKLNECMVREWKQQKAELRELCEQSIASRNKLRLKAGGKKLCLSTIEDGLVEKITQKRE